MREADDIKKLIFELSSEVFHPIDRETILRLILGSDDIAAYTKAWSRRIIILSSMHAQIPDTIIRKMIEMSKKVLEATKMVRKAIEKLVEEPKVVLEIADRIERIEEEVDDIRIEVFNKIVASCDSLKTSACMLCKELMDSIENAADKCEDVADTLRSLALLAI